MSVFLSYSTHFKHQLIPVNFDLNLHNSYYSVLLLTHAKYLAPSIDLQVTLPY